MPYTTNSLLSWSTALPLIHSECRTSELGLKYCGNISQTASGVECQRWDSQTPHSHNFEDEQMPGGSLSANENYCRNPDNRSEGLWCYNSDLDASPAYEVCDVPWCSEG